MQDPANRRQDASGHGPRRAAQAHSFIEKTPENSFLESRSRQSPTGEIAPTAGPGQREATEPPAADKEDQVLQKVADIDPDGRGATLSQREQRLRVTCGGATTASAKFFSQEVSLSPPQNPSNGLHKLMLAMLLQEPFVMVIMHSKVN